MITQSNPEKLDIAKTIAEHDTEGRLEEFFQLLMNENKRINLVSRETSHSDLRRLAAESLYPLHRIRGKDGAVARYLDIGSGGGFPAIPIMLSLKLTASILVERTQNKTAALGRIIESMEIQAEIRSQTYEECRFDKPFDLITVRYVKMTPKLLKSIRSNLSPGGKLIYYAAPLFTLSHCATYQFIEGNSTTAKSYSIISI